MPYTFEKIFAADPERPEMVASNGVITVFAPGDESKTPVALKSATSGLPLPNPLQVNASGWGPALMHDTLDRLAWEGGGFSGIMTSYEGLKDEAIAARQAAQVAALEAQHPTDESVDRGIQRADIPGKVVQAVAADESVAAAAAAAVGNALNGLEVAETLTSRGIDDVEGGVVDDDGRATWLTHDGSGGPTAYAADRLGMPRINGQVAGGFIDADNRETDLVFGPDGHITDRVMALWAARLGVGATKGLVTTDTRIMWGDSMTWGRTNGATPISAYLETLLGKTVVNKGVSGENSTQIMNRMLADTQYRDAVVYLWAARNDIGYAGNTPEKTVRNNRRMLEHMTAVRRRVLILEPSPWNGEVIGSTIRTKANGYDNYVTALKAAFPEYWVPLGSWMLTDDAAAAVGHTWTEADNTARSQGQVPPSFLSDNGHYNTLGNQAAAFRLHQEELDRGWI